MSFWKTASEMGLFEGDPTYYSSGKASDAEIIHALRYIIKRWLFK